MKYTTLTLLFIYFVSVSIIIQWLVCSSIYFCNKIVFPEYIHKGEFLQGVGSCHITEKAYFSSPTLMNLFLCSTRSNRQSITYWFLSHFTFRFSKKFPKNMHLNVNHAKILIFLINLLDNLDEQNVIYP